MADRSVRGLLISGSIWVLFGKAVVVLGAVALNALLARLLSPEDFGAYVLIFSFVQFLAVAGQLGLSQAAVRLIAKSMGQEQPWNARVVAIGALKLACIGAMISALVTMAGGGQWVAATVFNSTLMQDVMIWAGLLIVVFVFQPVVAEIFRGFYDIKLATIFGGLSNTVLTATVFALLWLLYGSSDLEQVLVLSVLAGATSVFISLLMLGRKVSALPERNDREAMSELISVSWPLWVTAIMFFMMSQVDLWIMGAFREEGEVAIYGAAFRMVLLMTLPLFIVNSVIPPMIAEMHSNDELPRLERIMRITATVAAVPALVLLCLFLFWSDSVLGLVFGAHYREGAMVLMILSVGHFINVISGACGLALMMTGHQKFMMLITLVSGLITIIAAVLFVGEYGAVGVACSACAGMLAQNVLALLIVKRKLGIWTHIRWISVAEVKSICLGAGKQADSGL